MTELDWPTTLDNTVQVDDPSGFSSGSLFTDASTPFDAALFDMFFA